MLASYSTVLIVFFTYNDSSVSSIKSNNVEIISDIIYYKKQVKENEKEKDEKIGGVVEIHKQVGGEKKDNGEKIGTVSYRSKHEVEEDI
jgi:hypothetical protein